MTDDEVSEARKAHIRAVTITVLAALAGVFAAVLSGLLTADLDPDDAALDLGALSVLLLAIMIQVPLYPRLGFDDWGGGKDVLYVAFMTFALWFITYGVILTAGVEFI